MEARHRRWVALANGRASGERGGHRGRRAEPNAGAGTPGVCPHHMILNTGRAQCARTPDPCNKTSIRERNMLPDKLIDVTQRQEDRPVFDAGLLLTELLSDPIMHMLMAADRVEYRDIEAVHAGGNRGLGGSAAPHPRRAAHLL